MNLCIHMYVMTLYMQGIISYKLNVCFVHHVILVNLLIRLIIFCRGRLSDQVNLLTRRLRCNCKFIAEPMHKFMQERHPSNNRGIQALGFVTRCTGLSLVCDSRSIDCSTCVFSRGLDGLLCVINLSSRWEYLINDTVRACFWPALPMGVRANDGGPEQFVRIMRPGTTKVENLMESFIHNIRQAYGPPNNKERIIISYEQKHRKCATFHGF